MKGNDDDATKENDKFDNIQSRQDESNLVRIITLGGFQLIAKGEAIHKWGIHSS